MRSLAAAFLLLVLACQPVLASGSIECTSPDGDASLGLTIGSLPILAVVGAAIEADGKTWTLNGDGESALAVGQAYRTHDAMRIDFTDPNVERVVAEVRLFSASEGKDMATAGTVKVAGSGAWAVTCTGP